MEMTLRSHTPLNGDYYQPRDFHGPIGPPCKSVSEAVQQALCEDGYDVRFQRDEQGVMHCYTSASQVGLDSYRHVESGVWPAPYESSLADDQEAIAAICEAIMLNAGRCHEKHDIWVDIDTYVDGELICVNFEPLPSPSIGKTG